MTEQRREENGPVRKLWEHVDEWADDLKTSFDCHIEDRHDAPLRALEGTGLTVADLIHTGIEMHYVLPGMADFLYGPPKIDPMTRTPLVDGNGRPLRDEEKGAQHAAHNGGFKAEIPWRKLVVAFVMQLGAIVAAVIIVSGGSTP